MKPLRLGVDTNVLLDLADGEERVADAFSVLAHRLASSDICVLPSVLDELAFLHESGETAHIRQLARRALHLIREHKHGFRPLLELACPPTSIEEVAGEIRSQDLLPPQEVNDSLILAEAALAGCALLLSSDEHLRGVDHERLTLLLNRFDLVAPVTATPREIVHKFFH
ncbi:MAG TPA: type II toxin-antitoxin system VapC family toxin [Verrucomicrobiae bacterium]|nr:type II toxin-antitoxin system VapC family toxin [Verrucomicrobiae bacterium]